MQPPSRIEDRLEFIWKTHELVSETIRFSDGKTAMTMAVATALIGWLHAARVDAAFKKSPFVTWDAHTWASVGAFALLLVAILAGAWSIIPRLRWRKRSGYIFWQDILTFGDPRSFLAAMERETADSLASHLAESLFAVSVICERKYWWLRLSMVLTLAGGLLGGALLLLWQPQPMPGA